MALKENYKNDTFAGERKYNLINNSDGTVTLRDATDYVQAGDLFGAEDINATNTEVNHHTSDIEAVRGRVETLESHEVYSTEEQRVGTWIDGKPIYRQVFITKMPSTSSQTAITPVVSEVFGTMVNLFGTITLSNGSYANVLNYSTADSYAYVRHDITTNKIVANAGSSWRGLSCCIVVEYTKTTD